MKLMRRNERERGASLVLLSLMVAIVIIPMVGLAIDGTIMYLVRAKLSQACDSAALAGARSLSTGQTLSSQSAAAVATAQSYFMANFPNGYLGITYPTDGSFPSVTPTQSANSTRTVTVAASVSAPTYFMQILGSAFSSTVVVESAQSTRRDVNLMLVLDRSNSMQLAGVCPTMISNAQFFISGFANGRDEVGLITFMSGANVDYTPTLNFNSSSQNTLSSVLGTLICGGDTGSAEALTLAYQQIVALNQPGRQNVIVFFTDGNPNGVTIGNIPGYPNATPAPIKTQTDTRYDPINYSTLETMGPSTCPANTVLQGAIAQEIGNPSATVGYTSGLYSSQGPSIGIGLDTLNVALGCMSSSLNTLGVPQVFIRNDLAYIPVTDSYGNSTIGAPVVASDYFSSGPYAGQLRPDVPVTIVHASTSAAYSAGATIHADKNFNITVYCIGLGGTTVHDPVNSAFLATLANDPAAVATYGGTYNANYQQGLYIYSPTIAQLTQAYRTILSQILRLSQ
jgi:Flp pilus assembly protein TadG